MRIVKMFTPVLVFSLLAACSDSNSNSNNQPEARAALSLSYSMAPIDLIGITANYAMDIRYGEAEKNLFDIYLPECDAATPLVIYIHGGGFTGGDKSESPQNEETVRALLQSCIAYATINYSLLTVPSADEGTDSIPQQGGVLPSLLDAARALQFMRYHYESLNLDPEQVAVFGESAGAGASLWLGTHDDLADPNNADPVLHESTRIKAVGALHTQSTYDLLLWEEILLPLTEDFVDVLGGTDIPTVAAAVGASNYLLTFLSAANIEDVYTAQNVEYRANVDMLGLMDSGDAPIFVENYALGPGDLLGLFLHHSLHAVAIKSRADEVGLENVAYIGDPEFEFSDPSGESLNSFLIRHIQY